MTEILLTFVICFALIMGGIALILGVCAGAVYLMRNRSEGVQITAMLTAIAALIALAVALTPTIQRL